MLPSLEGRDAGMLVTSTDLGSWLLSLEAASRHGKIWTVDSARGFKHLVRAAVCVA